MSLRFSSRLSTEETAVQLCDFMHVEVRSFIAAKSKKQGMAGVSWLQASLAYAVVFALCGCVLPLTGASQLSAPVIFAAISPLPKLGQARLLPGITLHSIFLSRRPAGLCTCR